MAFTAGNLVQLLTGGPVMVVDNVKAAGRGMGMGGGAATDLCECVGFSPAGLPFRVDFAATSLQAASPTPAPPPPTTG